MKTIESIKDIKDLVRLFPNAVFLKDSIQILEACGGDIDRIPVNAETLDFCARMTRLLIDPACAKLFDVPYPPDFSKTLPKIIEIKRLESHGDCAHIDMVARSGLTRFSFELRYQPDPQKETGHIVSVVTKLLDQKLSGLPSKEIERLVTENLPLFEASSDFYFADDEETGDLLLVGSRGFTPFFPLESAVELVNLLMLYMELGPQIQEVFSKANPDSFMFSVDK